MMKAFKSRVRVQRRESFFYNELYDMPPPLLHPSFVHASSSLFLQLHSTLFYFMLCYAHKRYAGKLFIHFSWKVDMTENKEEKLDEKKILCSCLFL